MNGFQIGRVDPGLSEERTEFFDRVPGKFLVALWLFATALTWCVIRSHYVNWGEDGLGDEAVPLILRALVMLAMLAPVSVLIWKDSRIAWLSGLSIAIGMVPLLPLLPFIRDYTHLVVIIWALVIARTLVKRIPLSSVPLFAACFFLYIGACILSAGVNFILFHNVWQLKVSVSYLILFGAFATLMFAVVVAPSDAEMRFDGLLDGFVWGVAGQTLIAMVAVPLIFILPFTNGNDTIFGLGYYDKFKSTFSGPVALGMFFLMSVPLLLLWTDRKAIVAWPAGFSSWPKERAAWVVIGYFQLMPWFMMATGSRTARVTFAGTLVLLLAMARTRFVVALMLPSTITAYLVGFYYQSLPAAINRFVSNDVDPSRNLSDRFFSVPERTELVKETVNAMNSAPPGLDLIGFGPGVGGYRVSGFPAPHNLLMNIWVETGALGAIAIVCFYVVLVWGLVRHARPARETTFPALLLLIAALSFALTNIVYNPMYWGLSMMTLLITVSAVVAFDAKSGSRIGLDQSNRKMAWSGKTSLMVREAD